VDRLAWLCFAACLAVAGSFIAATTGQLPAQVASHFGAGHAPNGWMSRDGYLAFMLVFALGLPLVVAGSIGLLPRLRPNSINIPQRDYWLDPARRAETIRALAAQGAWLGCLVTLFFAAIHYVVLEANRASPPRLPADLFIMLLATFVGAIALWVGALWLRFRRPG
jgi:uncharacterized membrane protein